jgi:NAD(P)-dependent dehydrogenase (short-subunit alcohol dehydrogenase family)
MDLGIRGRVALVTGGSGELGLGCALGLAREGVAVCITARDQGRLDQAAQTIRTETGQAPLVISADLKHLDEANAVVAATAAHFGRLDILINNAGASRFGDPLTLEDEAWVSAMDLKYFGYLRCARAAAPHMMAAGWGRIINILGAAGKRAVPVHLPGGSANAALTLLTKGLGMELARHGVLVNALSPAGVLTDRYRKLAQAMAEREGITMEEALGRLAAAYPIRRLATVAEVADAVCFLASERASFFVGTTILMDGGDVSAI